MKDKSAWKEVLGARDEVTKDRCMKVYKRRKKKRLKGVFIREKRRSMNTFERRLIKI